MTELRRLELAACALAATLVALLAVMTVDALRFHGASPILLADALIAAVIAASFTRQALRQRAFLARLPAEPRTVLGVPVLVLATRRPHAFCVGLLRPRVVVSTGLIDTLSGPQLRSVLLHERHHAHRRDPLRRALIKAFCDGFWFVPTLRATARAQATISELAADAVAIRATGAQPLAAALLAFEDDGRGGPSAGRVRQLLGERIGAPSLLIAGAGLLAFAIPAWSEVCVFGAPLLALLAVCCVPAALVSRAAARRVI